MTDPMIPTASTDHVPNWRAELAIVAPWGGAPPASFGPTIQARSVILSDPLTSQVMGALGGYGIADYGTVLSPNGNARPLSLAGAFFRNPCQSSAQALAALRAADVRLVLYNSSPGPQSVEIREHRDSYYPAGALPLLRDNPHVFRPVYEAPGMQIFEFMPCGAARLSGKDIPVEERKGALLVTSSGPITGETPLACGVFLVGSPHWRARRGGRLDAELVWTFTEPGDNFLKVRFHAINHGFEDGLYRPWAKLHRKLIERWEGRMYRFGWDTDLVPEEFQVLPMAKGDAVRPLRQCRHAEYTWR